MFAKIKNRIVRSLVILAIPATAALGLAGNVRAECFAPVPVIPVQATNSLIFSGRSNGVEMTLQLFYVGPQSVCGYIWINNARYQFVASVQGGNLYGVLNVDGREVRFNGIGQANLLYVQIEGRTITLQTGG